MNSDPTSIIHHPFVYPVGPLPLTGFGLALLLAFVVSQIIAQRELTRRGHDANDIPDLLLASVVGTLIGGKLYYAILTNDWGSLLSRAGLVFWGGLMGGILITLIVILVKKIPVWRIADVAGIAIAAGYSVGRTGCWAVGDDYGRPWNSPLAVQFPEGAPPSTAGNLERLFGLPVPAGARPYDVVAVHPTQIYETVLGFIMFAVLWRLRDHRHAQGWLFGVYCLLAGIERFIIEFFRAKDDRFFGTFTMAQLIALGFIAAGATIMTLRSKTDARKPGIYATA